MEDETTKVDNIDDEEDDVDEDFMTKTEYGLYPKPRYGIMTGTDGVLKNGSTEERDR